MFNEPSNNDLVFLPIKRINIPSKFFTIGIRERKEEELGVSPGSVNVISLVGDEQMSTLFLSLAIARTTIVQMESKGPRNVAIVHPVTFSLLATIKKYFEYFLVVYGNENAATITWHPVSKVQEIISIMEGLNEGDVFIDLFSDAFLDTPRVSNSYMNCLKDNKEGKFILISRFSRKKLVITKLCDNELIVEARKSRNGINIDPNSINSYQMNWNPHIGTYRVNGKDAHRIDYSLYYPFYIRDR